MYLLSNITWETKFSFLIVPQTSCTDRPAKMNIAAATRSLLRNAPSTTCFFCQISPVASRIVFRQLSSKTSPSPPAPAPKNEKPPGVPEDADAREKDFTPKRLLWPLGMDNPPRKGENSGLDTRTLQQKRDDFVNWEKHLEKRKRLYVLQFPPYGL